MKKRFVDTLEFDIEHTGHGWLWVSLTAPSFEDAFPASDVPLNSVQQLADALHCLLEYKEPEFVIWNSEPYETEFRFERQGDDVRLSVWGFPNDRRTGVIGEEIGVMRAPWKLILEPFVLALKQLEADQKFRAEWDWPLDTALVSRLSDAFPRRRWE